MSPTPGEMRLYDEQSRRLYINHAERLRFLDAAARAEGDVKTLCLTLLYTGCRISEALNLTAANVQLETRVISIRSLKKRQKHSVREVPMPLSLAEALAHVHDLHVCQQTPAKAQTTYLWQHEGYPVGRTTAWRWVKDVMQDAKIGGMQATAKGLRHGYGINAIRSGIQLHTLQKWMGHADMKTTAIYANAIGREEQELAERMW